MLTLVGDPRKRGADVVTMWIPTPSMTLRQRLVLYGTCAVALLNSVGLLVLLIRQNDQRTSLVQMDARMTEVEQSSVVEFLQAVPRKPAGLRAQAEEVPTYQYQYQNSRNKRSEELEKELQQEPGDEDEEQQVLHKEMSQEVTEETEKKRTKHVFKHKARHSQSYHKTHVQDDMMMMMTYSMVPVSSKPTDLVVTNTMTMSVHRGAGLQLMETPLLNS